MALDNRFLPSHPAGQSCLYGLDFSALLPFGVGIASGSLTAEQNLSPPTPTSDLQIGPVTMVGRRLYALVAGGVAGRDYRLTWTATDSLGNVWPRTALLLCAATS